MKNFVFDILLLLIVSCSKLLNDKRGSLQKKFQESRNFPIIPSVSLNIPETLEDISRELERLLFKTLDEVQVLLQYINSDPKTAYKCSRVISQGENSVHFFGMFYLALRYMQTSLQKTIQFYFPEKFNAESLVHPEMVDNRMTFILPSLKLILRILPELLVSCISFDKIDFPSQNPIVLTFESLNKELAIHLAISLQSNFSLKCLYSEEVLSFTSLNSVVLYEMISRLNMLVCLYHLKYLQQHNTTVNSLTIVNQSPIYQFFLPFQFTGLFILQCAVAKLPLISSDPNAALRMIESLAQKCERNTAIPFFDSIFSPVMLRAVLKIVGVPKSFIDLAKARIAVLEELERKDRLILLESNDADGQKTRKTAKASPKKPQPSNRRKDFKESNPLKTVKKTNHKEPKTFSSTKQPKDVISEDDVDVVVEKMKRLEYTITLPTDIHFIRLGQYCFDNVLFKVLREIPNNHQYTWTMVADHCVTDAGQDALYHLGISIDDVNDCIQIVRDRAERAHPKDVPEEQVQRSISMLLAFHRNFHPLQHLLGYINSRMEWKLIPGRNIPVIDNEETENVAHPDLLTLAAVSVGEYCLETIFEPAARFLGLDTLQSSMTKIIKEAEKHLTIAMPDGSSINPDLLKHCKAIYKLRNKYVHQFVSKKQAKASQREAYGSRFADLSILNKDFEPEINISNDFW